MKAGDRVRGPFGETKSRKTEPTMVAEAPPPEQRNGAKTIRAEIPSASSQRATAGI